MLKLLYTLAFVTPLPFALPTLVQVNTTLPTSVQKALQTNKLIDNGLLLVLIPLDSPGNPTYYNVDISVNPASAMKLFTTYTALEVFGPAYQWKAEFYIDGQLKNGVLNGNLYLKGGSDPKLNTEKFWLLVCNLCTNGMTKVTDDLVLDRNYFNIPQSPVFNDGGGDDIKPFLVGLDSLLVSLKSMRMVACTDGNKVNVQMSLPLANVRINNQMKMTAPATCPAWSKLCFSPVTQFDGTTLLATGQIPQGYSAQTYMSLLGHPGYTAGTVRGIWQELGSSTLGKGRQGSVSCNTTPIAKAFSPDLIEIIRDINKYSNNTMARQLFLSIGAQFRSSANGDDAQAVQRVVRQWLARKGITMLRLVMENGSGLSRQGRVSACEMAAMLQAVWHNSYTTRYVSSLPLAGLDGTIYKRLRRTALVGEAHTKTGTLNTVRALTGFSRDASGYNWVVVTTLNSSQPWGASAIPDQVLLSLHAWEQGAVRKGPSAATCRRPSA